MIPYTTVCRPILGEKARKPNLSKIPGDPPDYASSRHVESSDGAEDDCIESMLTIFLPQMCITTAFFALPIRGKSHTGNVEL